MSSDISSDKSRSRSPVVPAGPADQPSKLDWIAVIGGIVGAFMAVLDIQITNASLQDIQGALSATVEEGSWISTSYLIAEVIVIPMSGWLAARFGLRPFILTATAAFTFFSLLCSFAWNLESMIVFRAFQGMAGGVLIPTAFTIISLKLPLSMRAKGMALFGITATFAPAIGPTLGGWLTAQFSWHYIFYINLPAGILMFILLSFGLQKGQADAKRATDWPGILTMAAGLGSLQYLLEEGQRKDWFTDPHIVLLTAFSVSSLALFIWRQLSAKEPLLQLRILGQSQFLVASIASAMLGLGLYGSVYLMPLYLARVQGYNALQIGEVIMWMGLPQLVLMPLVPKLMQWIDSKYLVATGFLLFALSSLLTSHLSLDMAHDQLIIPQLIRALGQPLIMVPMSLLAIQGIKPQDLPSASSLFNIFRNLGGAVGIALLATLVEHQYAVHLWHLSEQVNLFEPATVNVLQQLESVSQQSGQALAMLQRTLQREATIMAYNDAFSAVSLGLIGSATVLLLFIRPQPAGATSAPAAAH
jgi:MFS transporter, DHA2 family, multidrug resistance protein